MLQHSLTDPLRQTEFRKFANELAALSVPLPLREGRDPIDFDASILAPLLFDMLPAARASSLIICSALLSAQL